MTTPVISFFNNKGGVGKTSLVYHLSWMLSSMGHRVVAIDLDPQANLTSAFLDDLDLEVLWEWDSPMASDGMGRTVFDCVKPMLEMGDLLDPAPIQIEAGLFLVPGDLGLAGFEDSLSREWPNALDSANRHRAFRMLSAFWTIAQTAATSHSADVILADVGPNLGAINRSALIATDHVVIPLAADLFSLQGLHNLGPTLQKWRADWRKRVANGSGLTFSLPRGNMAPLGYVVMQHSERLSRPVKAYKAWADRIPTTYDRFIVQSTEKELRQSGADHCIARVKHYRSLVPMAQEARKPIFSLTPADGAIGNHSAAVRDARSEFRNLANTIWDMTVGNF